MAKAEEPPSPVDAYQAPASSVSVGDPAQNPYSPSATQHAPQQYYGAPRATNVLAIIALIASCVGLLFGLGAVAGVIMGFISLSQIKRSGEGGHGLAVAAIIVGFVVFVVEVLLVLAWLIFFVWIVGTAGSEVGNYSFNQSH